MALKHSAVARTTSSPAQTGNLSPLDIAHVAYSVGFRSTRLTTAVAVALAESGGNPKNVSPTDDHGLWQINRPSHPTYFTQANRIYDPLYNAQAAFAISKGGTNWSPWTTYRSGEWKHYYGQGIPTGPGADKIIASGAKSNASGGGWNPIGNAENAIAGAVGGLNPIKWVDEAAKAIVGFLRIMVDPEELGRHLANMLLWLLKQFAKGFYNIIVLPPWRWSQRATIYYYKNVINEGGNKVIGAKAMATMGFWAIGYAILWGRFEPVEMRGVAPGDSALAGTLNMGRNAIVSRRITKPKDVDAATAKKPKVTATTIPVTRIRAVSASRRRAVKVAPAGTVAPGTRVTDASGKIVDKDIAEHEARKEQHERDTGHQREEVKQHQSEEVVSEEAA